MKEYKAYVKFTQASGFILMLSTSNAVSDARLMQVSGTQPSNRYIKVIEYGSSDYLQAAHLRYRLFYQNHNIPFESIFDEQEQQDLHVVITTSHDRRILAYGRLAQTSSHEFQIYQMVVEPDFQGQGLGSCILQALAEVAVQREAALLVLNARVTQTGFYQKFGFEPVGEVFASSITGVPHIKMQKKLMYSSS